LTATSSLKDIVPYKAWISQKLDISHLHIWRSFGWTHVPKQVQKGKLESKMVSVRLLEWWNNEMKGYRLEDLESGGGKVITSQDVKFIEDKFPSDLTVVDVCRMTATAKEINRLIDGTISLSMGKLTISSLGALSTPDISKSITPSPQVSFLPSILTSSITNEGKLVYPTLISLTPIDQNLVSNKVCI